MLNRNLKLDVGEQKFDYRYEAPLPLLRRGRRRVRPRNHKLKTKNY